MKKKPSAPIKTRFSNVFSFLTGLSIGLFVAVIVYFYEHNATIKSNNTLLVPESVAEKVTDVNDESIAQLPEPQFDFYQILPNKEVHISEWESVEEEVVAENNDSQQPSMFVLQVGSFKEYQSADEIKAKLALMGVTADIQRVVINGQDVRHRVRVGPYKNTNKLQQARDRLLANDLDFMLLKLKMEDI
ncbi:MAG: SPOR domain-containing protein [Gammaproteobacteria bacterium]|jgi:cell division protein FtsN